MIWTQVLHDGPYHCSNSGRIVRPAGLVSSIISKLKYGQTTVTLFLKGDFKFQPINLESEWEIRSWVIYFFLILKEACGSQVPCTKASKTLQRLGKFMCYITRVSMHVWSACQLLCVRERDECRMLRLHVCPPHKQEGACPEENVTALIWACESETHYMFGSISIAMWYNSSHVS